MPTTPATPEVHSTPHKILVCQLRQLGDVLLATPTVALLAKAYPDAEIHFFTEKKCISLLENNPHIHTIWAVDKKKLKNIFLELQYYRSVTAESYDLVIDFQHLPRCRWVVAMSCAPVRIAESLPWYLRWLYTHNVNPTPSYAGAFKAQLLKPLGITWNGERPELYLTGSERAEASALLADLGKESAPFLSVDVSHRQKTRRWPAASYASLLDQINESLPGIKFFLPYGPGEEDDIQEVVRQSKHPEAFLVPKKIISLRLMAACMEQAAAHLGNCSAPRHIAVALDVPSFTIRGATSNGWTFPSPKHISFAAGLPCQACNKNTCPIGVKCLTELDSSVVFPAFLTFLQTQAKLL